MAAIAPVFHDAAVGVGALLIGLILQDLGANAAIPEWYMLTATVSSIPAGILGGFAARGDRDA